MRCGKNTAVRFLGKLCRLGIVLKNQIISWDQTLYYTIGEAPACASDSMQHPKWVPGHILNTNKSYKSNISIYRKNNEAKSNTYGWTADEALAIWNRELGRQDQLYQELARYLVAAVRDKFHSSLERWREFVLLVKSSAYLMGEKCHSWFCLRWVLLYKNMKKILAGELGVRRDSSGVPAPNHLPGDGERHIASLAEDMKCLDTRRRILKRLGESIYMSWMPQIRLESQDGRVSIASAPSRFVEDWVNNNFLRQMCEPGVA
jgi:hypothetical protein